MAKIVIIKNIIGYLPLCLYLYILISVDYIPRIINSLFLVYIVTSGTILLLIYNFIRVVAKGKAKRLTSIHLRDCDFLVYLILNDIFLKNGFIIVFLKFSLYMSLLIKLYEIDQPIVFIALTIYTLIIIGMMHVSLLYGKTRQSLLKLNKLQQD